MVEVLVSREMLALMDQMGLTVTQDLLEELDHPDLL